MPDNANHEKCRICRQDRARKEQTPIGLDLWTCQICGDFYLDSDCFPLSEADYPDVQRKIERWLWETRDGHRKRLVVY